MARTKTEVSAATACRTIFYPPPELRIGFYSVIPHPNPTRILKKQNNPLKPSIAASTAFLHSALIITFLNRFPKLPVPNASLHYFQNNNLRGITSYISSYYRKPCQSTCNLIIDHNSKLIKTYYSSDTERIREIMSGDLTNYLGQRGKR